MATLKTLPSTPVMVNGEEIERVSKYIYGYTVGKNIEYALVERVKSKVGEKVVINGSEAMLSEKVFC